MRVVTGCVVVTSKCWKGSCGMTDSMSTDSPHWSCALCSANSTYVLCIIDSAHPEHLNTSTSFLCHITYFCNLGKDDRPKKCKERVQKFRYLCLAILKLLNLDLRKISGEKFQKCGRGSTRRNDNNT